MNESDLPPGVTDRNVEDTNDDGEPLTNRQLTALKSSIEHWRRMVEGKAFPDESPVDVWCPLCVELRTSMKWLGLGCENCPVFIFTNRHSCEGTPYHEAAVDFFDESSDKKELENPKFKAAALKELKFLESLLTK